MYISKPFETAIAIKPTKVIAIDNAFLIFEFSPFFLKRKKHNDTVTATFAAARTAKVMDIFVIKLSLSFEVSSTIWLAHTFEIPSVEPTER